MSLQFGLHHLAEVAACLPIQVAPLSESQYARGTICFRAHLHRRPTRSIIVAETHVRVRVFSQHCPNPSHGWHVGVNRLGMCVGAASCHMRPSPSLLSPTLGETPTSNSNTSSFGSGLYPSFGGPPARQSSGDLGDLSGGFRTLECPSPVHRRVAVATRWGVVRRDREAARRHVHCRLAAGGRWRGSGW